MLSGTTHCCCPAPSFAELSKGAAPDDLRLGWIKLDQRVKEEEEKAVRPSESEVRFTDAEGELVTIRVCSSSSRRGRADGTRLQWWSKGKCCAKGVTSIVWISQENSGVAEGWEDFLTTPQKTGFAVKIADLVAHRDREDLKKKLLAMLPGGVIFKQGRAGILEEEVRVLLCVATRVALLPPTCTKLVFDHSHRQATKLVFDHSHRQAHSKNLHPAKKKASQP